MSRLLVTSLCMSLLAATAWAQEGPGEQGPREGRRRFGPPQERRGGPGRDRSAWMDRMYDRLAEELDLDDDQRSQFNEITAAQREQMREMGRRWTEIQQATRDGDEERAAQLRAEMPEWRGPDGGLSEALGKLEPILRDDQVAKLWEIQDRMERRDDDRQRYRSLVRDLPDELELDDTQREEFDRLLSSGRERMRERWSEMRPLMEELRAASEAGDQERVAELRSQLEEARPDSETMLASFFEELEGLLSAEQLERLAAYRQRMEGGGPDQQRGPSDVRNVLRAARRLRLDSEQKEQLRDIEREAVAAFRHVDRRDREEQAQLAAEVKKEIIELLDTQQAKQFDQQLQRLERRNRRER